MKRAALCLVAVGLVASACGGTDNTSAPGPELTIETAPSSTAVPTTSLEPDRTGESDVEFEVEPIGPDPIADEPIWSCNGQAEFTLDELLEFDGSNAPSVDEFAVAAQWEPLGEANDWVKLSDRWIADRRLLDSDPPAMVIGDIVDGGAFACVPIRQASMRPVAWQLLEPAADGEAALAVESCVEPDTVVVDARTVGNQLLIGLFVSNGAPVDTSCEVDGEMRIVIPAADDADIVSSQQWPFEAGDPARWYVDGRHSPVVPLDASSFGEATCTAVASATEIFVSFRGLPAGVTTSIYADGSPWLDHDEQLARRLATRVEPLLGERFVEYGGQSWSSDIVFSDGGYSYFGPAPGDVIDFELRLSWPGGPGQTVSCGTSGISPELPTASCSLATRGGQPRLIVDDGMQGLGEIVVFRDGELLDLGLVLGQPVDVTAEPGVLHEYAIEVNDRFAARESERTPCGSFIVVEPDGPEQKIKWALELFEANIAGPHLYFTVVRPSGAEVDVAMTPTAAGYEFLAPDDPPTDADPITLHARLLEALTEGRDVSFEFDPWAGVPTQWSIDGVDYQITCLEFDTAPLELRDIQCGRGNDLVGPRR